MHILKKKIEYDLTWFLACCLTFLPRRGFYIKLIAKVVTTWLLLCMYLYFDVHYDVLEYIRVYL
jgi:hypothetical protein